MKTAFRKIFVLSVNINRQMQDVLRGVMDYAGLARNWDIMACIGTHTDMQLENMRTSDADGGIACLGHPALAPAAAALPCPMINIDGWQPLNNLPQVGVSDLAIGEMAARYFLDRGIKHFAFCGHDETGFSAGRFEGFRDTLDQHGFEPRRLLHPSPVFGTIDARDPQAVFFRDMPKPFALFCVNDMVAHWMVLICRHLDLAIPREVMILGVDNSDIYCETVTPHISSIECPWVTVGAEAARILDGILKGHPSDGVPKLFHPLRVIERASTDRLLIPDPRVVEAIRIIRNCQGRGITPAALARKVKLSRRQLDASFRRHVAHTVYDEMVAVRIDLAKNLLTGSNLLMEEIAEKCGFTDAAHFGRVFKIKTGITPGQCRAKGFRPSGHQPDDA